MRKAAAVLVGVFLFVGLFVLPAAAHHKNGHDGGPPASAEDQGGQPSGSGGDTQGDSGSNPDGGGVDKPYDAAGQPARSQGPGYHDGNNGCGQDKKSGEPREGWFGQAHNGWDDNKGWCGKPVQRETDTAAAPAGTPVEVIETAPVMMVLASGTAATFEPSTEVSSAGTSRRSIMGTRISRAAITSISDPSDTAVLGIKLVRGQPLAVTGISMTWYLVIAAALGFIGVLAMTVTRKSAVRI